ncbi:hypothetical protein CQA40_04680 [Helicobacter sp. MIT 01-3238]|nr:hypothetical protein CQA40_04680 [Helicobacter sp. MIT 01-3238]
MPLRHCKQVARLAWQSIFVFVDCHESANADSHNDGSGVWIALQANLAITKSEVSLVMTGLWVAL